MSGESWSKLSVEQLLTRARHEEGAREELLRRSMPRLAELAARRVSPAMPGGNRPSDVAQEAALKVSQKFSSFRGTSEGEWWSWLRTVVNSRAADLARNARAERRDGADEVSLDAKEAVGAPSPQRSPSQVTSGREEWRRLLTHFSQLPEDQREAMSLYHLKNLSVAEVARRMGRSTDATASLLQRGLRTLRKQMQGEAETHDTPEQAAARNAVDAALLVYFRRREGGTAVDPDAFSAEFPSAGEELREMLHWMEQLQALQPPEGT